jgi:hypothetical protein
VRAEAGRGSAPGLRGGRRLTGAAGRAPARPGTEAPGPAI